MFLPKVDAPVYAATPKFLAINFTLCLSRCTEFFQKSNTSPIERLTYVFCRYGINQRDIKVNQCQRGEAWVADASLAR
jgi:hypothetical protein